MNFCFVCQKPLAISGPRCSTEKGVTVNNRDKSPPLKSLGTFVIPPMGDTIQSHIYKKNQLDFFLKFYFNTADYLFHNLFLNAGESKNKE